MVYNLKIQLFHHETMLSLSVCTCMSDINSEILSCFFDRCPKEMSPHLPTIIKLCLKYITYDPNYNYDADDDQDDSMDIEEREDEDQGD